MDKLKELLSKKYFLIILISIFTFILDQITKYVAFAYVNKVIEQTSGVSNLIRITGFFNISKVWNTGISFGMFSSIYGAQIILSIITILIIAVVIFWSIKVTKTHILVAIGLILGGAFGNLIDRLRFGAVADFLDFHIASYHWPSFNIADSVVFIGVVIIIIDDLFFSPRTRKTENKQSRT
ncbi:signal peptidase II [Pseudomonadota bacterium]